MSNHWMDAYPVGTIWVHTAYPEDPLDFMVEKIDDEHFEHIGRQHKGKVVKRDKETKRKNFRDYIVPENTGIREIEWI